EVIDGVVGDVEIGLAVVVEIRSDDAEPFAHIHLFALVVLNADDAEAGLLADLGEGAVAVVAEEQVGQAGEAAGRADVALNAGGIAFAGGVVGERPIDVLADVEVGIAVAIDVRPGGAGGPGDWLKPGGLRPFDQLAALLRIGGIDWLIVIQGDAAPAGDE